MRLGGAARAFSAGGRYPTAYYNENDPYAALWLRNLISQKLIAPGDVDERSILDVAGDDLRGYVQCHFFAGIGGWSYALRLAGWPDDRPVWTGSCPCQPLSGAGQRKGHADERHLWPAFHDLIAERAPPVVFGEQVASKDGREWLAGVRADLEGLGYAVGAADLCAASVSAPHIRQRLWWVASGLADAHGTGPGAGRGDDGEVRGLPEAQRQPEDGAAVPGRGGTDGGLADAGRQGCLKPRLQPREDGDPSPWHDLDGSGENDWLWLPCTDGKARRTQSGIFPLASGLPTGMDGLGPISRVGTLRGAGNSIVPQVAAEFIQAFEESRK